MDALTAVPVATSGLTVEQVWAWLEQVPDPEIPVLSVIDLGIVRKVELLPGDACAVTITPTYSGCPAMAVIGAAVTAALHEHGVAEVRLLHQLSPAWTTDWLSARGRRQLTGYGIAPPARQVIDIGALGVKRRTVPALTVACPRCGSGHTVVTSQFGSTPCKALYQCLDCREPFDYFKCH